jgi:hypothetical protein
VPIVTGTSAVRGPVRFGCVRYPCCCDDCFESEDGRQSMWSGPVEYFIEKHAGRWFLLCCHRCCGEDGLLYRIEDPGPDGNVDIDNEGSVCGVIKWHGYDETGNIKPGVTW